MFHHAHENPQCQRLDRRIMFEGKSAAASEPTAPTGEPAIAEERGRPDGRRLRPFAGCYKRDRRYTHTVIGAMPSGCGTRTLERITPRVVHAWGAAGRVKFVAWESEQLELSTQPRRLPPAGQADLRLAPGRARLYWLHPIADGIERRQEEDRQ
ncbi:hypothetical protein ACCAA_680043 [Candidatus Accumulibacter aalborgensis]|uniref:Uncharacterized protein n=1 Tax=Candidatus Accumulibacter aalborgensis TaxID=1860102 RepID=A0A1A8XWE5_9PROT|nr:hypothetical protein ACCAA_680043 [Candidatus Accumulibacter aalborgensis]